MGKYYRRRSEYTKVENDILLERDIELLTTPVQLTTEEYEVYQKLRSDKLIKLKDLRKLFDVAENTMPIAFILSMDVPVYRLGQQRGSYYVFSSDVVKAFTRLRLPSGVKFKRRLLTLAGYRDLVQRGSFSAKRADRRGIEVGGEEDQEKVLEESGRSDGPDGGPRTPGRKRGRKAESLQQDLGRVLGSWKQDRDAARFRANLERNSDGSSTDHRREGGANS